MFSSRRLSRPAQPPPSAPNSGALAAATVIGKALKENDHKPGPLNLPRQPPRNTEAHRTASLLGSRRTSSVTSATNRPASRAGSFDHYPSSPVAQTRPIRSAHAAPKRAQSMTNISQRAQQNGRLHSLTGKNSTHYDGFDMDSPAASTQPRMVKKWVPSAHGLVCIEVPAEQPAQAAANARRVVARSASMNSLSSRARSQRFAPKTGPQLSQKKSVQSMHTQNNSMVVEPTIEEDESEEDKKAVEPSKSPEPQLQTIVVQPEIPHSNEIPDENTSTEFTDADRELAEQKLEALVRQKEQEILQAALQQQELEAAQSIGSISNDSSSLTKNPISDMSPVKSAISGSSGEYPELDLVNGYTGRSTDNLLSRATPDDSLTTATSNDVTLHDDETKTHVTSQDSSQSMAQRLRPTLGVQKPPQSPIAQQKDIEIPARSPKRPSISKLEDLGVSATSTPEKVPKQANDSPLAKRKSVLKNTHSSSKLSLNNMSASSSAYLSLATAENTRLNAMASSSSLNVSQQPRASPATKRFSQPEKPTRQSPADHKGMRLSMRATPVQAPRSRRDSTGGLPSNPSSPAHLVAATRAAKQHNPQQFETPPTPKKSEYKAAPKSEAQLRAAELYKKANEKPAHQESILNVQYVQQVGVKLERTSSFEKTYEAKRANRLTLREEPAFVQAQEQQQQQQPRGYQAPYKSRFNDSDSDLEFGGAPAPSNLNGKPSRNTLRSVSAEQPRTGQQAQPRFFSEHVSPEKAPEGKKKRFGKLRKLFGSKPVKAGKS